VWPQGGSREARPGFSLDNFRARKGIEDLRHRGLVTPDPTV